jgi:hypothetical protein
VIDETPKHYGRVGDDDSCHCVLEPVLDYRRYASNS